MKTARRLQNPVAADVSPRHFLEFAPTNVGGYEVVNLPPVDANTTEMPTTQDQPSAGRATLPRSLPWRSNWLGRSLALPGMAAQEHRGGSADLQSAWRVSGAAGPVANRRSGAAERVKLRGLGWLRYVLGVLLGGVLLGSAMTVCGQTSDRPAGTVVGWGNLVLPYLEPGIRFQAISAGGFHTLALTTAGTVVAWGGNQFGQCMVPANLNGVIAIAAGGGDNPSLHGHSLALKSDGTVVAWGDDRLGQSTVPADLSGVIAIAAGGSHSLALKSDGTVVGWGWNYHGQCTVPANLSGVIAIAAGNLHSLALKSDGTVVAWGWNGSGQSTVPADLSGVTAIAAGGVHSLALKSDRTVVAWGGNWAGQSTVPANLSGVTAIAVSLVHSLALKSDGTVVAWGRNEEGQSTVPADLSGVIAIAVSGHNLALKSDGTVVAWGWNGSGQSTVPADLRGVIAIAAGGAHSLALKSDGTVVAWGSNWSGTSTVPADLSGVIAIAAGAGSSLAIKAEGPWGAVRLVEQPVAVPTLAGARVQLSVAAVGAGPLHYQWRFAPPGQPARDIPGATSATLVLATATAANSGQYSVRVWNATSSAQSQPAYLAVLATGANGNAVAQVVSPTTIAKQPGKTSLVIVTHGWDKKWRNLVPNNPPPVMAAWVTDLANAISTKVPSDWQVVALDWMLDAWTLNPDFALFAGDTKGTLLGKTLAAQSWEHVHLIGHSAGSALIHAAACEIKRSTSPTVVHCTFLDPYLSSLLVGDVVYGGTADWADCYYTAREGGLLPSGEFTGRSLVHAHNEEVSWLDPDHRTISYHTGVPYLGNYSLVSEAISTHQWPHEFYLDTVTNLAPRACAAAVGFRLSKEGGHWDERGLYPVNNQPVPLCGDSPVMLQRPLPMNSNPFFQLGSLPKLTSGSVGVFGQGFNLNRQGSSPVPPGRQPKDVGDPVWLAVAVEVTNAVNFVEFEAGFSGIAGGQGLMTLYWNTNQIGMVDERVALAGLQSYRFALPGTFSEGLYTLSFQLDTFTNLASSITVTNVATGFVGITEPLRLTMLPPGTNAVPLLQLTGAAGYHYMVEGSTNLVDWTPRVLVVNSNGMTQFPDPGATNTNRRFYRAVMP